MFNDDFSTDDEDQPTWRQRLAVWLNKLQFFIYTTLVIGLLALGFLWRRTIIVVPPGHLAVMYRSLYGGTLTDRTWGEGIHVIPPWDRLTLYETRLQQKLIKFDVLSEEGISLRVQVSVRYRPHKEMLGHLQKDIGPDYYERFIKPEVEAHVRRTFGGRSTQEIYSSARDLLQEMTRIPVIGRLEIGEDKAGAQPYLHIQELKLLSIELPELVQRAISEKYRQEQMMLAYKYKLEAEEKEAQRKRIEAGGIRDYNLIVGKISPDLLRWRGVDAAADLAKSQNSKVIILGGGSQGGLPMLLNLGDSPSSPAPPPAAPAVPEAKAVTKTRAPRDNNKAPPAETIPPATVSPPTP